MKVARATLWLVNVLLLDDVYPRNESFSVVFMKAHTIIHCKRAVIFCTSVRLNCRWFGLSLIRSVV